MGGYCHNHSCLGGYCHNDNCLGGYCHNDSCVITVTVGAEVPGWIN